MKEFPKIQPMGERGILIEFEPVINEASLENLLFLKSKLQELYDELKVEVVNTYSSILISYRFAIADVHGEISRLRPLLKETRTTKPRDRKIVHLPVCYEEAFGWDLDFVAREKGLSIPEVIRLHTAGTYRVYFIGFLPGFPYLGGLDPRLSIPRKDQPRLRIEKGAVGIGEEQTGIYPSSSPGGWQILGNCPVPLFHKDSFPPCPVVPGDKVKFFAIDIREYQAIAKEVAAGEYNIKIQCDES